MFNYRLSATYGLVRIAKISTSSVNDIFGATVNRCSKINYAALKNGLVIGSEFYDAVKFFDEYDFKETKYSQTNTIHNYTSYVVLKK